MKSLDSIQKIYQFFAIRKIGVLGLFIFLFIQCRQVSVQYIPPTIGYETISVKLEDAIQYEITDKGLNALSIVLVDKKKIVWCQGFGYKDSEKKIKANANTVYRVGSVSKLFTDLAIMQKVEREELDLDAPIQNYLPDFNPENPYPGDITLRQLMSHRSGLLREPRIGNYFDDSGVSLLETVESIHGSKLIHEPESKIKYSNAAIAVVGYVLEKLSNMPYVDYMKENVLDKIGMTNSAFIPNENIEKNLADATMWSYDGRVFPAPKFELGMAPAGSLYANMKDLGKFLIMLFSDGKGENGQVISKESLHEMWQAQYSKDKNNGYGIGFGLSDFKGKKRIGHGGAIYGFSTQLYGIPELDMGVACASSVDVSNTITRRLSNYALDLLYAHKNGNPLPQYEKTAALNEEQASELLGSYASGDDIVRIVKRNDQILLKSAIDVPLRNNNSGIITDGKINFGIPVSLTKDGIQINGRDFDKTPSAKSSVYPDYWDELIGEYGWDHNILFVYEDLGKLWLLMEWIEKDPLTEISKDVFAFPESRGMYHGERIKFIRNTKGEVTSATIENGPIFYKRDLGVSISETFKIDPVLSVEELRKIALVASPPQEEGEFNSSDLVELKSLDESIKYDIRYASTNNFMNNQFYSLAKAYLQRPAAEALVRVHQSLKEIGYGLLIHDAYRPWYVTKMFWDATPEDKKIFVANPNNGSRHNRGCAIDLTLFELKSGEVIEMVAGYDEMTDRSFPDYYGGTTKQRWHRELLRKAMEKEGFSVYQFEWWHFDYHDWEKYKISNVRFEDL